MAAPRPSGSLPGSPRSFLPPALLLALAIPAGCGYHLAGKTTLPEYVRRIAVPTFDNRTEQPDIAQRITERVIDEFVVRGGYVATSSIDKADATLEGVVEVYSTQPVAINEEGRATRFEIQIQVDVELRDLANDTILWGDDHFVFRRQYDVQPDQQDYFDESILAIEQVSRDFARSVVASILEGF